MFINAIGYHVPETRIPNSFFKDVNGLTEEWIYQRTGIKSRSRASEKETMNYMCLQAVEKALPQLRYNIMEVDLIIFASYTPSDTIGTTAHYIQREYNITDAKVFQLSSACSSGVNGIEVIKSFFTSKIASKALLICADRNSGYSDDSDCTSGHLWGDAAVAYFFSNERFSKSETEVLDVLTQGLGHIGCGPEGVTLKTQYGKIQMPYGKDVFMNACNYLSMNTEKILIKNGYSIEDLSFFIGHQANMRILKNVANKLEIPEGKSLSNIEDLGNTGSASSLLVFAMNYEDFRTADLVCLSVFGGGYSAGACLFMMGVRKSLKAVSQKEEYAYTESHY